MRKPIFVLVFKDKIGFKEFNTGEILEDIDSNKSDVFYLPADKVHAYLDFINLLPEYVYFICQNDEVCSPIKRLFFFTLTTNDVENLGLLVQDLMSRFNEEIQSEEA